METEFYRLKRWDLGIEDWIRESYMSDRRDLGIEDWILVNLTCRIGGIYV